MTETAAHDVFVTLVFGTWGKGLLWKGSTPRWFERGSQFYDELCKQLSGGGRSVGITALDWTGDNSVEEREKAARRLVVDLTKLWDRLPHAKLVVVAHSHGGNVLMRALGLLDGKIPNIYAVTLATPFLELLLVKEDAHTDSFYRRMNFVLQLSLPLLIVWLALSILLPAFGLLWTIAISLALVLASVYSSDPFLRCIAGISKDAKPSDKQKRLAELTCWDPKRPGADILVLRSPDDEAGMALAFGAIGNRVSGIAMSISFKVAVAIFIPVFAVSGIYNLLTSWFGDSIRDLLSWVLLWGLQAFVIFGLVMVAAIVVGGLFKTAFGRELFFGHLRCEVNVNSAPDLEGGIEVLTLRPKIRNYLKFRHGLYEHEDVVPMIAEWLRRKAGI